MSTYEEINRFLSQFNPNSYNREQIGNNKQLIIKVFEYINKFNVLKKQTETIINNIAYLKKDNINIPIYLEILSKSTSYLNDYKLKDLLHVVKQVHDVYLPNAREIELDEYTHATQDERTRMLFLTLNNKYLNRQFTNEDILPYVSDLKFALAIELDNKEYQDFINYIDNFETFQNTYSPIMMYKKYLSVRDKLKDLSKLFWDLIFGNEYMVALVRYNLSIKDIHTQKKYSLNNKDKKVNNFADTISLELSELDSFQISVIYSEQLLNDYETEKEILEYYEKLETYQKEKPSLPKLKNSTKYLYQ